MKAPNNKKLKQPYKLLSAVFIMLFASAAFGQFIPPPPPPPPPGFPIDGGLFILAIAGAYYGAKKIKK
ncbi:MAG: hypothetical protein COS42_08585 [Flavobacteriales bacterium CG03_land_8_20_14_0_80_35_15]|nr:MAG: hypothetical protein COV50_01885 [Flavobacteriales bacterium CG11_big_fil_rev_8_21_14_0_20_35_7]PIV16698.1 MAG: hypothetical protein COS42_08585 [Flavobacteriales bacterium CG03_land_8_20_14_0_80_35_15]PIX06458.1 MAG: hypothetical protein COZ76_08730 [Flavobacteriales bacterium CG_4_8_14_3_um_filter_35_10]PJA05019.1 MAG: hypothetical protein COX71_08915 [Flavobacteriales bacterium CG_4_10_14_0_2_um_filter_35_18]